MNRKEYSKRTKQLIVRAYEKLQHPTNHERVMESRLASAGLRYRMQCLMEPWIVDFYLPEHGMVVEVDGASHDGRSEQDAIRTWGLMRRNDVLCVSRVPNGLAATFLIDDLLARKYAHNATKPALVDRFTGNRGAVDKMRAVASAQAEARARQPAVILRRKGNI